mgnify:CR=1 FL=1
MFLIKYHDSIYQQAIVDFIGTLLKEKTFPNRATLKSLQKKLKEKIK